MDTPTTFLPSYLEKEAVDNQAVAKGATFTLKMLRFSEGERLWHQITHTMPMVNGAETHLRTDYYRDKIFLPDLGPQ